MKKISLILIIWLMSGVGMAHADKHDKYTLLEPLPCIDGVSANCASGKMQDSININDYFLYIYKFAIAGSVFLAIVMIIWGGFQYITSEIPFIKSDGKSKITNAVSGLAMVLVSYLILQTIDPRLVSINANLPALKSDEESVKAYINYQTKLADELKLVNVDNQAALKAINNDIKLIEQKKIELDAKIKKAEITPDEAKKAKFQIQAEMVMMKTDKQLLLAVNEGISSYGKAVINISNDSIDYANLNQYIAPLTPNGSNYPVNTPNVIQNQYNTRIRELKKINAGSSMIPLLERQSDFIVLQIKDSVEINSKINELKQHYSGQTYVIPTTKVDNSKYLNERVAEYETKIADAKKESSYLGIPEEQYVNIFQAKISVIKQSLEPKK